LKLGRVASFVKFPVVASAARQKHTLPDLPYDYNALEPVISAEIMRLHHSKHHQAYVNGLNQAEEKYSEVQARGDVMGQIALQPALKFNGGGHINHTIFWNNLAPTKKGGGNLQSGKLLSAINEQFGDLVGMIGKLNATTAAIQGSGWGWLGFDKSSKQLVIATTPNQDPLQGLVPLLGIDVWEHAYYLQYKNVRPDYLKEIWKVVDWNNVQNRYVAAY